MLDKREREKRLEMMEKKQDAELKILTDQQKLMETQQKLIEIAFNALRQH